MIYPRCPYCGERLAVDVDESIDDVLEDHREADECCVEIDVR